MNCSYSGFPVRLLFSLGIKIVYALTSLVFYICIANSTPQFSPHQLSPADVQMQRVLCKLIFLTQSLPEGSSWPLALCLGHSCHPRAAFTLRPGDSLTYVGSPRRLTSSFSPVYFLIVTETILRHGLLEKQPMRGELFDASHD